MTTPDTTQDDRNARVAFQGAPGAFSHEACVALRPWDEAVPFETFAEALAAVRDGDCDMALIPIENSTIGAVEPAATLVRESGFETLADVWRVRARVEPCARGQIQVMVDDVL